MIGSGDKELMELFDTENEKYQNEMKIYLKKIDLSCKIAKTSLTGYHPQQSPTKSDFLVRFGKGFERYMIAWRKQNLPRD